MKEFFTEIIDLLAVCILVICLSFASFLFVSNFYHYKEVHNLSLINMKADVGYQKYKAAMAKIDKKMKSVDHEKVEYSVTAKPIYDYYTACIEKLNSGTFAKFENMSTVSAKDVYDANNEILTEYNNSCIFYIPYNITRINKVIQPKNSFASVFKKTEEKRNIVVSDADYLVKSGLGNSSYSFVTETSRGSIYNKTTNELKLTINNYNLMASILDDVATWYASEFGGSN